MMMIIITVEVVILMKKSNIRLPKAFFGNDEFTYTIIDRNGATDSSRVTVTVNEVILAPHPIIYWLENEGGITQDLLEKARRP